MTPLVFDFEWTDPAGARGDELRATWARASVSLGEDCLSRVYDQVSRSVRESIFVPLYPLAEWIATHWWSLLYEVETPGRRADVDYKRRHSLSFAREGFAYPPVLIVPTGDSIRLQWSREKLPHARIEFLSEGTGFIALSSFEETARDLIRAVLERMDEFGVPGTLLAEEWRTIEGASAEEKAYCIACATLGLDPYAMSADQSEAMLEAAARVPPNLQREFFATADYSNLSLQTEQLEEALATSRSNGADLSALKGLRSEMNSPSVTDVQPWHQGYDVARRLRSTLELDGQPLRDLGSVSKALGIPLPDLERAMPAIADRPTFFDAVVDVNSVGSPGFVLSSRFEETRKFAFCRGLFDYLTSDTNQASLATRARSDRQRRNRAFAAEFLLPASALRSRVQREVISEEEMDDLAAEFGVSTFVVKHQLENHKIARAVPA